MIDNVIDIDIADPVVRDAPLNVGCDGWWLVAPHSSGGPRWYDFFGSHHGTLGGFSNPISSAWKSPMREGGYGSLSFDGVDDIVDCGADFPDLVADWTIAGWFRSTRVARSGAADTLWSRWTDGGTNRQLYVYVGAYGPTANRLQIDIPFIAGILTGATSIVDTNAHHFAATRKGNEWSLYLDGNLDASTIVGFAQETGGRVMIGATETAGPGVGRFAGLLDDFRAYHRALSASEIAALRDASMGGYRRELRRIARSIALFDVIAPPIVEIAPDAVPTAETTDAPTIGVVTDVSPDAVPTAETIGVPTDGRTTDVTPGGIPTTEVVPSPTIGEGAEIRPYDVLGGLVGRSMASDAFRSAFAVKLQAGVSDEALPTPYATIEWAGGRPIGSVIGRRYTIEESTHLVTVVGKTPEEIGRAWRALDMTFGNFAMRGNRIKLAFGEIISTVIEHERFSPSAESDKSGNLVRWKKANLRVAYTKRLSGA